MLNRLIARRQRPEHGWDPIPPSYAQQYAAAEWAKGADPRLIDELDRWVGGLEGKRVIDLGGGPGHYTVALAERGAIVTWYDVSREYLAIAQDKVERAGLTDSVRFEIGYMDEAPRGIEPFDLVFNRICWYYGFSDASFADVVYQLVRPGGSAYIDVNPSESRRAGLRWTGRIRAALNDHLGIKVGHPFPPHGRLEQLFRRYDLARMLVDYRSVSNDRVWLQRRLEPASATAATGAGRRAVPTRRRVPSAVSR